MSENEKSHPDDINSGVAFFHSGNKVPLQLVEELIDQAMAHINWEILPPTDPKNDPDAEYWAQWELHSRIKACRCYVLAALTEKFKTLKPVGSNPGAFEVVQKMVRNRLLN